MEIISAVRPLEPGRRANGRSLTSETIEYLRDALAAIEYGRVILKIEAGRVVSVDRQDGSGLGSLDVVASGVISSVVVGDFDLSGALIGPGETHAPL